MSPFARRRPSVTLDRPRFRLLEGGNFQPESPCLTKDGPLWPDVLGLVACILACGMVERWLERIF
ncbi:MAG: hypothetical protein VKO21_11535 [Candidatus Sericytochromatia bacterium]|nr:hypothetical protein [Candidatus Sericytochromatia bacterium]